jgi:hypothetical protein
MEYGVLWGVLGEKDMGKHICKYPAGCIYNDTQKK